MDHNRVIKLFVTIDLLLILIGLTLMFWFKDYFIIGFKSLIAGVIGLVMTILFTRVWKS